MLCCARILVCNFGFEGKINLWGAVGVSLFGVWLTWEEGTMPGKVSAVIMSFGTLCSSVSYSVQFLADWVDSWWGPFPIGELSCHLS